MIIPIRHLPLACVLMFSSQVFAQPGENDELAALREEIRTMRGEYESRIADLEARLDLADAPAAGHACVRAARHPGIPGARRTAQHAIARGACGASAARARAAAAVSAASVRA